MIIIVPVAAVVASITLNDFRNPVNKQYILTSNLSTTATGCIALEAHGQLNFHKYMYTIHQGKTKGTTTVTVLFKI